MLGAYQQRVARGQLEADAAQAQVAAALDALARDLRDWRPGQLLSKRRRPRGLYIWGPVGRGKSLLLDLFFESAEIGPKRRVHFHEFMQTQHAFMREARASQALGQDELIARAARAVAAQARLLCFDEVQVTDIADAMILGRLFERLFAAGVVIVATSNRPPDDLYKNGINRQLFTPFIALLKENLTVAPLDGPRDYRLAHLRAAPVYYAPLGPAADAALDEAWRRLTHGAAAMPVAFDVNGRVLRVVRQAAGVARFAFEELCVRSLGPGDYLELAERFHTILIEGVPRMTGAMREAAARFRTLIDALYEAKVKLIISAEAQPFELYAEGDQSFEFERTASRLIEMQSDVYLALPARDSAWKAGLVLG